VQNSQNLDAVFDGQIKNDVIFDGKTAETNDKFVARSSHFGKLRQQLAFLFNQAEKILRSFDFGFFGEILKNIGKVSSGKR